VAWAMAAGLGAAPGCGTDRSPPAEDTTGASTEPTGDATSTGQAGTTEGSGADSSTGAPAAGWAPSLEVGTDVGAFWSVWGPSPAHVYAAAAQPLGGGFSRGALWRWDGAQWAATPLPDDTPGVNWVFGVGTLRVIVGELGLVATRHGDEGEWTRGSCGTILPFWGVWGAAPDDVWAVGGDGFSRDPTACHFDGRTWTPWELPEPAVDSHALYKVWGTAADDVWAVGDTGLVLHWGGPAEGWVEHPSGTAFDLISLWGTGPSEILAVGGRASGILARWDGVQWTAREVPALPGLNGVWMATDGTATVAGPMGGMGTVAPGALEVAVEDAGTSLALHAVYGFDGAERWAVGGSLDMAPPHVGVIVRRVP
jgi:hypothetical protein